MSELFSLLIVGAAASLSICTFSCVGYLAPVLLAEGAGWRSGVRESFLFMSGKILLYTTLGGMAAWTGSKIPPQAMTYGLPVSGAFLILLGVWLYVRRETERKCARAGGTERFRLNPHGNANTDVGRTAGPGLVSRITAGRFAVRQPGRGGVLFLGGLLTSLVPCPAVLALLTLAAAAPSVLLGFAYGLAYGVGLLVSPVLLAGGGLSLMARRIRLEAASMASVIRTVSAVVIILSGIRMLSLSFS